MASQDDFVRITLRLPADLHDRLSRSAAGRRSLNAEIVARLEAAFAYESETEAALADHEKRLEALELHVMTLRYRAGDDVFNQDK